jgi:hypothetical protein
MKKSVSSVLAERIKERRAVTPAKIKVRYVKFSPEEMEYDIPADVSHLPFKRARKTVELEEDVAKVFRDSATVNNALRKLIQAMPSFTAKRKSA